MAEASSQTSCETNVVKQKRKRSVSVALSKNRPVKRQTISNPTSSSTSSDEEDHKSEYVYTPLAPDEIRLLVVHPGNLTNEHSLLDCSLKTIKTKKGDGQSQGRLQSKNEYEALSYVWGNQEAECTIHIRGKKNGTRELKITANLLSALRHLRREDRARQFWVDAVCINQAHNEERSQQVAMMSQIYSEAKSVCVWLGESDDTSGIAIKLAEKLRDLAKFDDIVEKLTTCDEWAALMKLMQRPWFTRRWVVQEITLAKEATIRCGSDEISWSFFSEAIALFEDAADRVNQKFKEDKDYKNKLNYVGDVKVYAANRLVAATNNIVRKSPDNRVLLKVRGLEYLVSTLTPFCAKNSPDIVYAVLSLAHDIPGTSTVISPTANITNTDLGKNQETLTEEQRIMLNKNVRKAVSNFKIRKYPVDYNKPFMEICTDFLDFAFRKSGSLDMICRPWATGDDEGLTKKLPSWIQTLENEPYGKGGAPNPMFRQKGDVLVGNPGESIYSASGKYPAEWKLVKSVIMPTLKVRGFVLDEISKKSSTAEAGVVPRKWFRFGGWKNMEESPPDPFWRTIVADRDPFGRNPPSYYPLACKHALTQNGGIQGNAVNTDIVREELPVDLLKKFISRLQSVIWSRRLARTERHKFLALVPEQTKLKDLICILPGCSVPVVLRKREEAYKLIGETYVHGMMDGEAFQIRTQDNREYEEFALQ